MRGVIKIIQVVLSLLPPWAWPIFAGVLLLTVGPLWAKSIRIKQVRNRIRFYVRAPLDARQRYLDEAFRLSAGHPRRLATLADEAIRFKLEPVWRRALRELEATGRGGADLEQLRAKVFRKGKVPVHPIEEAVAIARMLDTGATERARERLERALRAFPDDPDLLEFRRRLDG